MANALRLLAHRVPADLLRPCTATARCAKEGSAIMNSHATPILVVDDDPDTCRIMADVFGDLGYAIETAEGGDIALEKARRQPYDLGHLDLRMPGMDGLTLCRHLKQLHPLTVAMIVTGYAGGGLDEEARAAGARHVLTKPVNSPRLLALVGEALAPPN